MLLSSTHTPDVTVPGTTFTSTYYYDALSRLAAVDIADGRRRTVSFANTAEGMVLRRDEKSAASTNPHDERFFLGNMQVGFLTNNGLSDPVTYDYVAALGARNLSQGNGQFRWGYSNGVTQGVFGAGGGYDPINPDSGGGTAQRYTARQGDTLASIAAALWGDSSLWFMLAEANGMTAGTTLIEGQSLVVPNRIANSGRNNVGTFSPYDPNHALGDLSPTTPKPAQAQKKGCSLAMIIVIVIAVAVTAIATAGATALLSAQSFGAVLTGTASAGSISAGAWIAGGAIGGAIGSLASQGAAIAFKLQDRINWKGVGLAAISGAVSGGLNAMAPAGDLNSILNRYANAATSTSKLGGVLRSVSAFMTKPGALSTAVRNMASSALTQGIGVATKLQKDFDLVGVAAAGISGAFTGGTKLPGPVSGMAGGIVNVATRSLLSGTSFGDNLMAALPDIVGSTIGNSFVNAVRGRSTSRRTAPPSVMMKDIGAKDQLFDGKEYNSNLNLVEANVATDVKIGQNGEFLGPDTGANGIKYTYGSTRILTSYFGWTFQPYSLSPTQEMIEKMRPGSFYQGIGANLYFNGVDLAPAPPRKGLDEGEVALKYDSRTFLTIGWREDQYGNSQKYASINGATYALRDDSRPQVLGDSGVIIQIGERAAPKYEFLPNKVSQGPSDPIDNSLWSLGKNLVEGFTETASGTGELVSNLWNSSAGRLYLSNETVWRSDLALGRVWNNFTVPNVMAPVVHAVDGVMTYDDLRPGARFMGGAAFGGVLGKSLGRVGRLAGPGVVTFSRRAGSAFNTTAASALSRIKSFSINPLLAPVAAKSEALTGTALARKLGVEGEQAIGITGPKVGIRIPGSNKLRFPDKLDLETKTLIESKNVGYQGYTRQLRDYAAYAQDKGFTFELYVRGPLHPSGQTILSGPLESAIRSGTIKPKFIPGTF